LAKDRGNLSSQNNSGKVFFFTTYPTLPTIVLSQKLVVKPDQLIKRRGKLGLIKVNVDLAQVQEWINERINRDVQVIILAFVFMLMTKVYWNISP